MLICFPSGGPVLVCLAEVLSSVITVRAHDRRAAAFKRGH
ncbi:hypothetical protein L842_6240 [Mycobacterium intracellulare MIN_052511_1280]|nr:hypothetical protein L842_6240 [Mycobacterium intracellulare MIN_052511_1280]